jgi:hypothetical protein
VAKEDEAKAIEDEAAAIGAGCLEDTAATEAIPTEAVGRRVNQKGQLKHRVVVLPKAPQVPTSTPFHQATVYYLLIPLVQTHLLAITPQQASPK